MDALYVDINHTDKEGNTPLILAIKENNLAFVRLLIDKGANLDIQNKDRNTALMCAAHNGHLDIANRIEKLWDSVKSCKKL